MKQRLIVRESALQKDGWTYGDWRQYVHFRPNGRAVLVRVSGWPAGLFLFGLLLLLALAVPVSLAVWSGGVLWERVFWFAFAGFAMIGPQIVQWATGWRLVVVVGTATRKPDGTYWRDL